MGLAISIAFDNGLGRTVFAADPTYLSWLIAAIFVLFTAHAGRCSWRISHEAAVLREIIDRGRFDVADDQPVTGLAPRYFRAVGKGRGSAPAPDDSGSQSLLVDVLVDWIRGPHEIGWFIAGVLMKLGLLGTVIGFILMLRSLVFSESLEMSDVHALLSSMTLGMGIALTTTLVGVITSVLLGFQYLLVDRGADRFVSEAIYFATTELNG